MSDVTKLLEATAKGDRKAAAELLPLVYDELRQLAAARLAQEPTAQTLDATALVHEAYLRLVGSQDAPCWDNRGHFFAAAAEAMRRLLVENARRKQTEKRGGGRTRVAFEGLVISAPEVDDDLVALDEALTQLTAIAPQKAELVKLRYFVGLTIDEAADLLGVSPSTAKRYWIYGRAWLYRSIAGRNEQSQPNR